MQTLVLASGSTWRKALLQAAGIRVQTVPAHVDERALEDSLTSAAPADVAIALARAKTEEVARRHPSRVVLGADQVIWDGAEVVGKPRDPEDHFARLCAMRGRSHELITAWCLRSPDVGVREGFERTRLAVRADLSDHEIAAYVDTGEGSGCAGGYAIEGHGLWLFEHIDGDWHNIIGLPMMAILSALREIGWRYEKMPDE